MEQVENMAVLGKCLDPNGEYGFGNWEGQRIESIFSLTFFRDRNIFRLLIFICLQSTKQPDL